MKSDSTGLKKGLYVLETEQAPGLLVADLQIEPLFEGHNDDDRVHRGEAEVAYEACLVRKEMLLDLQLSRQPSAELFHAAGTGPHAREFGSVAGSSCRGDGGRRTTDGRWTGWLGRASFDVILKHEGSVPVLGPPSIEGTCVLLPILRFAQDDVNNSST